MYVEVVASQSSVVFRDALYNLVGSNIEYKIPSLYVCGL